MRLSLQASAAGEQPCQVLDSLDSRPVGVVECSANYRATPVRYHTSSDSIAQFYYSQWGNTANVDTIDFHFSSPVWELRVRGDDIVFCTGIPSVVKYRGMYGSPDIEVDTMAIFDPADCGGDQMTYAQHHAAASTGPIDFVTIFSPTTHERELLPGLIAYMRQQYFFEGFDGPPADALNCLTGDRWVDQQVMRNLLADLWARTFANPQNPIEKAGVIFQDYTTEQLDFAYAPAPDEARCGMTLKIPSVPGRILSIAHTHPFAPMDTIWGGCDGTVPFSIYDDYDLTGLSKPDLTASSRVGWKIPRFVVLDVDNVYASPSRPIKELKTRDDILHFPRQDQVNACTIV